MPGGPALGADKTLAPASLADGLKALLLGGIGGVELPQLEALLKLDVIAGHGVLHANNIGQKKRPFSSTPLIRLRSLRATSEPCRPFGLSHAEKQVFFLDELNKKFDYFNS